MGFLFLLYIVYCVVAMYVPQSRQFLIDGVMAVVEVVVTAIRFMATPVFWQGLGVFILVGSGIALVVFLFVQLMDSLTSNMRLNTFGDFLIWLLALGLGIIGVIGALYFAGIGLAVIAAGALLYFVGLPILGIIVLAYLPAAALLFYKYLEYQARPHEAEPQFKQMQVKGAVEQEDIDAVKESMLQSDKKGFVTGEDGLVNVKNVLFGWIHTENRKEHLRRLREEMEEETKALNSFREYVRAKNSKFGSEYDK